MLMTITDTKSSLPVSFTSTIDTSALERPAKKRKTAGITSPNPFGNGSRANVSMSYASAFGLPIQSRPVSALELSVPRNSPVSLDQAVEQNDRKRSRDELDKTASQLFSNLSLEPSTANVLDDAIDVLQSFALGKQTTEQGEQTKET